MTEKITLAEEKDFINNANVDKIFKGIISDESGNQFTIELSEEDLLLLEGFLEGKDIDFIKLAPVSDKIGSLKMMKRLQEALKEISSVEQIEQYLLSKQMDTKTLLEAGFTLLDPDVYNARIMMKKLALKHYGKFPEISGIPKVELFLK